MLDSLVLLRFHFFFPPSTEIKRSTLHVLVYEYVLPTYRLGLHDTTIIKNTIDHDETDDVPDPIYFGDRRMRRPKNEFPVLATLSRLLANGWRRGTEN